MMLTFLRNYSVFAELKLHYKKALKPLWCPGPDSITYIQQGFPRTVCSLWTVLLDYARISENLRGSLPGVQILSNLADAMLGHSDGDCSADYDGEFYP